jgi:hypothetical protein
MKPKIEKQKTSRHWISNFLANASGLKRFGLYNREDYRFNKNYFLEPLDKLGTENRAE